MKSHSKRVKNSAPLDSDFEIPFEKFAEAIEQRSFSDFNFQQNGKTTLETSGEDVKPHSKRVGNM